MIDKDAPGQTLLLMGNEAIARGAIEAGVRVCAAYPGNPSSEIIGSLSKIADDLGMHVEWSVNEKVALEVVAAASFAGLRGLTAMKQNGLNVASDFLLNLNLSGTQRGLVLVVCDDPGALSSTNEEDSRFFAKIGDLPLLEPSNAQEAKDMTRWAFDLSEELGLPCIIRSVTRVSHARGNVRLGEITRSRTDVQFDTSQCIMPVPATRSHQALIEKRKRCQKLYEGNPFNFYRGPEHPELLIITSGSGWMYASEDLQHLGIEERVGIMKLGTTWPLPEDFLLTHLKHSERILFVEEVDPFLEDNLEAFWARHAPQLGMKSFYGKASGTLPAFGELNPDILIQAIRKIMNLPYEPRPARYADEALKAANELPPLRQLGFCAGCPHKATYWAVKNALALDGRDGFVLGDIGCYALGVHPAGFEQVKTNHAMGSGAGLANGFGQFGQFGLKQPVVAVCGDSTFFHAAIPALINARYNRANFLMLVLDNSATAMTGFQPHPGTGRTALGERAPVVDIEGLCKVLGAHVEVKDPFDIKGTTETISRLLQDRDGLKVLILRQVCALVRGKRGDTLYKVQVNQDKCIGEECGCNRLCTRVFKCPGLVWESEAGRTNIDEAICTGCGVCSDICPQSAIIREAS